MGFLIHNKEVGNIGLKQLREQREVITKRWDKIGLLEGLSGAQKENIALLYENQLNYLKESTDSAGSNGAFETVAFPVIRRVFNKILTNDIVSVQAMNLPVGKLFYINPKISVRNSDGSHSTPDGAYKNAATTSANDRTQFEERSLYDAYYATEYGDEGTSLFDRSKGKATARTGAATVVGATLTDGKQPKSVIVEISGITEGQDGKLIGPKGDIMDTESFLSSLNITTDVDLIATGYLSESKKANDKLRYRVVTQKYGQAIVNGGKIQLEVFLTFAGEDGYTSFSTDTGDIPTFSYHYNVYSSLEEDSEMAEVTFDIDEVTVSVETRKMRAQWTPELAADVYAFHSIDAEAELTALLSEQIAAEIDREVLRDLRRGAAWVGFWDYNGLMKQSKPFYGVQKDWNQTLITKINQISAQIQKSTLRGGANWVVVSSEISAIFDDLEYFHVSNADADQDKYSMGIERIGVLQNRYQVYRDPYSPPGTILIGHKGKSLLESGYIYAPYIPLQLTPVMHNPNDFKPVRGIMTRYAKKMVNNRFFGKIHCDGVVTYGIGELR